jgi:elongator complex protein 4
MMSLMIPAATLYPCVIACPLPALLYVLQPIFLAAPAVPEGGLAAWLPQQLRSKADSSSSRGGGGSGGDSSGTAAVPDGDAELRIAWQYKRYMQEQHGGLLSGGLGLGSRRPSTAGQAPAMAGRRGGAAMQQGEWSHEFDLSRSMGPDLRGRAECQACPWGEASPAHIVAAVATFCSSFSPPPQLPMSSSSSSRATAPPPAASPRGVPASTPLGSAAAAAGPVAGRFAVASLGGTEYGGGGAAGAAGGGVQAVRALFNLKALARACNCGAMVTAPPSLFAPADLALLQHVADAVLGIEAVSDESDIVRMASDGGSVVGMLHVRKLPEPWGVGEGEGEGAVPVDAALHLLRKKRRRLAITPVEVDPTLEWEASERGGAGSGGAAGLCGGPAKADRQLDY